MERLYVAYRGRGLTIVAVNYRESKEAVRAFMEELRLTFTPALDREGSATAAYGVRGLPVTFLVGRDGKILWKVFGDRRWDGPQSMRYFDRILVSRPR